MAEENKIILDADVKPLKKQLREATQELQVARQRFGDLSEEAVNAAKKVAGIRDSIQDANEQAQLFDPGKRFQALTSAASLAAGAVGAVQGAMGLFGAESEDVQKALLKVQSAMALSQGLSQLADLGKVTNELKSSFKGLIGTTAQKTAATTADTAGVVANTTANKSQSLATLASSAATKAATISLKVMRGALISLGIPALILGLVALVQNFGAIKNAVLNALPGLKVFSDAIGGLVQGVTDFFGITSKVDRALDANTKAFSKSNGEIENRIKVLTAQGGKEAEIYALQRKQIDQELALLKQTNKAKKGLTEEEQKRQDELLQNNFILGIEYNKKQREADKAAAEKQASESKAAAEKAKEERDKLNEQKLEADKKLAEEQKALQKEKEAQDVEFQKRLNEVLTETRLAGIKDENERARAELIAQQEQELADLAVDTKLRADQKLALQKQLEVRNKQELDALEQTFAEQDTLRKLERLDQEIADAEGGFAIQRDLLDKKIALQEEEKTKRKFTEEELTKINKENSAARLEIDMAEMEAKQEIQEQQLNMVGQFGNLLTQFAGKSKELAIAGLILEQGAALGKVLIGVSSGIAGATANAYISPLNAVPGGPIIVAANLARQIAQLKITGALSAAGIVAGAAKGIAGINRSGLPGGGGSAGGGAPSIGGGAAPQITSQEPTIGNSPVTALGTMMQNQPPLRAYVVESEVTGSQRRVADIERRAGF